MTNSEFMTDFWRVFFTRLRDQAFSIILLCLVTGGVIWYSAKQEDKFDLTIAAMQLKQDRCMGQHDTDMSIISELKAEVAMLRVRVDILTSMKR